MPLKTFLPVWRSLLIATLVALIATPRAVADGDFKAVRKRLREEVETWTLTPKVDISVAGVFHVYPDGRPTSAKQGKLKAGYGMSTSGQNNKHKDCMTQGLQYSPYLGKLDVDRQTVRIGLFLCSVFVVHYGRDVVEADLEPAAVSRALSGFFEIQGPNVGMGRVEAAVERALFPVVLERDSAYFQGIAFDNPAGWTPQKYGSELFYRAEGKREIRVRSRQLDPEELQLGAHVLLEEVLPGRLLKSARKLDGRSRVQTIARAKTRAPLIFGMADVYYKKTYERHDWVVDPDSERLYTFRSQGRPADRESLWSGVMGVLETVRQETPPTSSEAIATTSGNPDLPTPTDLELPGGSDRPGLEQLRVAAEPGQLRRGETVELRMSYEISGPAGATANVRETRTLSYGGEVLPNYPVVEESELSAGLHESVLPQTIPDFAEPGVYECMYELCIDLECETRRLEFEVVW